MRRLAGAAAKRLFPRTASGADAAPCTRSGRQCAAQAYLDTVRALAQWCALERLPTLQSEMLMLAGEHDYTPLSEKREYAERFGAKFAVVGGSRHGTPFDAVSSCNAVALAFFRGQPLPAAETLRIDAPERAPRAAPAAFSN
ncbi:MAG: hypothetical protein R3F08_10305 [Dokdonella sp.]